MGIQHNINNQIIQIAQLTTLAQINTALQNIGCTTIQDLKAKIRDIEILIASHKDQGLKTDNLESLLTKYIQIKDAYYKQLKEEKEKRYAKIFVAILIAIVIALIVFSTWIIYKDDDSSSNRQSSTFTCDYCGSHSITIVDKTSAYITYQCKNCGYKKRKAN